MNRLWSSNCAAQFGRFTRQLAILSTLCVVGCASVTGSSTQQIYVQVTGTGGEAVQNADCSLSNDKGSWTLRAPEAVSVHRSNVAMLIRCQSAGASAGSATVESMTRAAMFGNIILGGVLGAGIDHYSGSAYEYPGVANITLGRNASIQMVRPRNAMEGVATVVRTNPVKSGFAALDSVSSVPGPEANRNGYRRFLQRPLPRAIAISDNGRVFVADGWYGLQPGQPMDPNLRALQVCLELKGVNCRLYAVDNTVVYSSGASPFLQFEPTQLSGKTQGPPKKRLYALPPASGYADIHDASMVPVKDEVRGQYLQFLTLPQPRAFAIAADGTSVVAADSSSAIADVLGACEREGKVCWVYAADDRVVWQTELSQRTSRLNQLRLD